MSFLQGEILETYLKNIEYSSFKNGTKQRTKTNRITKDTWLKDARNILLIELLEKQLKDVKSVLLCGKQELN